MIHSLTVSSLAPDVVQTLISSSMLEASPLLQHNGPSVKNSNVFPLLTPYHCCHGLLMNQSLISKPTLRQENPVVFTDSLTVAHIVILGERERLLDTLET